MINKILNNNLSIYFVLAISIILKLMILYILSVQYFPDGNYYLSVAQQIYYNSFLYPSTEFLDAPLVPYFYALMYYFYDYLGDKSLAIGNIILATSLIFVMYKISIEVFNKKSIANTTALIACFYPFFNFYSITLLTEIIYIFFLTIAMLFAIKFYKNMELKYIFFFTLFFTIDTLVRFANLGMYPFFLLLFVFLSIRKSQNYIFIFKLIFIFITTFILTMSLWWIRNYNVYDKFVLTSAGASGMVFYAGNNPMNKSGGGIGGVDVDLSKFEHIEDLYDRSEAQWNEGIDWIKNNPKDWIIIELRKLKRFFSPVFFASQYDTWYYNLMSILSYGLISLFFVYELLFNVKKYLYLISPLILYSVLLTSIHLVFIASIRYRLPIEPFMIIIASRSIYAMLVRLKLVK